LSNIVIVVDKIYISLQYDTISIYTHRSELYFQTKSEENLSNSILNAHEKEEILVDVVIVGPKPNQAYPYKVWGCRTTTTLELSSFCCVYGTQALYFASIAEKWMEIWSREGKEKLSIFCRDFSFIPAASPGQSAHLSHGYGKYISYWSSLGGIL
jgi:hypothetical protein